MGDIGDMPFGVRPGSESPALVGVAEMSDEDWRVLRELGL